MINICVMCTALNRERDDSVPERVFKNLKQILRDWLHDPILKHRRILEGGLFSYGHNDGVRNCQQRQILRIEKRRNFLDALFYALEFKVDKRTPTHQRVYIITLRSENYSTALYEWETDIRSKCY